jgi:gas vesicle protein
MSSRDEGSRNGLGLGQLFIAVLGGAAAGAMAAYLTAPRSGVESRRRLRAVADDTRDTVQRVPDALRKATEAARDAFNEALRDEEGSQAA